MSEQEHEDYSELKKRVHRLAQHGLIIRGHSLDRMHEREVLRTEVNQVLLYGQIDPNGTRYEPQYRRPSYAMEGSTCERPLLRVAFVIDDEDKIRVITVYAPKKK